MRVTFERMADRRPVESVVERDDGVVWALRGAGGGADLPHDLVHALVEQELRVAHGVFGCVADGVVWRSMRHLSGRQPPHAAERSARLVRERAARLQVAELLADLVRRLARGEQVADGAVEAVGLPRAALDRAAAQLAAARQRWADLAPGATWTVEWPSPSRARGAVSRAGGSRARRAGRR